MSKTYKSIYAVDVKPSGETHVTETGSKCMHGVYRPANSRAPEGQAEHCTVCNPIKFSLHCGHGKVRENNAKIGEEQCHDSECIAIVFFDPAKFYDADA
jgi:hypothetical protein